MIQKTLWQYLGTMYLRNFFAMLLLFLGIVYLFDTVELIRRGSDKENVALYLILQMGLLKLPEVGQIITPFVILYSGLYTFWQLNRRSELVVMRSSGLSVWQFIAPILSIAVAMGVLQFTVINPVSAILLTKFEALETQHLDNKKNNIISLFENGLWLRQETPDNNGYAIIHAKNLNTENWQLNQNTTIFFDEENLYIRRIDAPYSILSEGQWIYKDAVIHSPGIDQPEEKQQHTLATTLSRHDIEESFSSPTSLSFWKLSDHIETVRATGFDTAQLQVHFHALLAQPLLFCAMILLAASVSLRPPRSHGGLFLIIAGISIGFLVFFLSSFLQALGASNQLPSTLAAWAPSIISLLLGTTVLLVLEDG